MTKLLVAFTFIFMISKAHSDGGRALYSDKLYELEQAGHIGLEEANEKIYALKISDEEDRKALRERARGVASAIKGEKIIKYSNNPIEVFVD